jgi:hypothetical protein
MRAASFKSLYQKRPVWLRAAAQRFVEGRSRYSTKTCEDLSDFGESLGEDNRPIFSIAQFWINLT